MRLLADSQFKANSICLTVVLLKVQISLCADVKVISSASITEYTLIFLTRSLIKIKKRKGPKSVPKIGTTEIGR